MWEAYGLENEDILWTCVAFLGGVAGEQSGPCGAVSASAVCLGLRHRCPLADKQRAKHERFSARGEAGQLVQSFKERFGTIACLDLVGVDFSQPGEYHRFQEEDIWKDKCHRYVEFVIEKLYELDEKRSVAQSP
jgi:C_GCAxxG_C_C family probable redox protein